MIEHVGPVRARLLLDHFGDAPAILGASKSQLLRVHNIGDETAEAIANWEKNIDLAGELKRISDFNCQFLTKFIFMSSSNHVFFATAGHVLFPNNGTNALGGNAMLTWHEHNGTNDNECAMYLNLSELNAEGEVRRHPSHDVAVVRLGVINTNGLDSFYSPGVASINGGPLTLVGNDIIRNLDSVNIGDDVYVFGYPTSIGMQESPQFDYASPLLRKGIVSGVYHQKRTIIIDAASYFGNSGGPVLERDEGTFGSQFYVIGVVSEYIPFVDTIQSKSEKYGYSNTTKEVSNSGYAVIEPVDFIQDILWNN
jgi:hypothetical protein